MKIKVKDLLLINNLVQVSTNTQENRIKKYIIDVVKEDNSLYVEAVHNTGNFSVFLRKEMENITKDEQINIADGDTFSEILQLIKDEEINIVMTKDAVKIDKDDITLATYEPNKDDINSKNSLLEFFKDRKYGSVDNEFRYYEEDKEKPTYDAKCNIDLSKLNAGKIRKIFSDDIINIKVQKGTFFFKTGKINSINRKIKKKGAEDLTKITGDCEINISDLGCLNILSNYKGFTVIELKKEYPMVIKKELEDEKIGVNYVVSIATKNE